MNKRLNYWPLAKIVFSLLALLWLFIAIDRHAVVAAVSRVTASAFLTAMGLTLLGIAVGAVRWRALLHAYGAPCHPRIARLFRHYLIGTFYNTWLPGAVAGDVVRGLATRESFGDNGTVSSVAVVLVERVLGLVGLLAVTAIVIVIHPQGNDARILAGSIVGMVLALGLVACVSLGHRIGPRIPGALGKKIAGLPKLHAFAPFGAAIVLSLGTQVLVPIAAHAFMQCVAPNVPLTDTLAVFPLVTAAAYFPFSVNGAGVRETAAAYLFESVGVAAPDAVAVSLLVWCAQAAVGALGGLLQLVPEKETRVA